MAPLYISSIELTPYNNQNTMSDEPNNTGIQGYADSETKLRADGEPDRRFKEVLFQNRCQLKGSMVEVNMGIREVARLGSRKLGMVLLLFEQDRPSKMMGITSELMLPSLRPSRGVTHRCEGGLQTRGELRQRPSAHGGQTKDGSQDQREYLPHPLHCRKNNGSADEEG